MNVSSCIFLKITVLTGQQDGPHRWPWRPDSVTPPPLPEIGCMLLSMVGLTEMLVCWVKMRITEIQEKQLLFQAGHSWLTGWAWPFSANSNKSNKTYSYFKAAFHRKVSITTQKIECWGQNWLFLKVKDKHFKTKMSWNHTSHTAGVVAFYNWKVIHLGQQWITNLTVTLLSSRFCDTPARNSQRTGEIL